MRILIWLTYCIGQVLPHAQITRPDLSSLRVRPRCDGTMPQAAAPDSGEATASPDSAEDFYALGEFFPSFEDYALTADAHLARDSRSPRASGKACDVPLRRGQTRSPLSCSAICSLSRGHIWRSHPMPGRCGPWGSSCAPFRSTSPRCFRSVLLRCGFLGAHAQ